MFNPELLIVASESNECAGCFHKLECYTSDCDTPVGTFNQYLYTDIKFIAIVEVE